MKKRIPDQEIIEEIPDRFPGISSISHNQERPNPGLKVPLRKPFIPAPGQAEPHSSRLSSSPSLLHFYIVCTFLLFLAFALGGLRCTEDPNPDRLFIEGSRALESGSTNRAITLFEETLAADPGHIESLISLSFLYTEKNLKVAENFGRRAVELLEKEGNRGRETRAKEEIEAQAYANLAYIQALKFDTHYYGGEPERGKACLIEAIDLIEKAAGLDPENISYIKTKEGLKEILKGAD